MEMGAELFFGGDKGREVVVVWAQGSRQDHWEKFK